MFTCKWQGPLAVVGIMTLVSQKGSCDKMVGESSERQTSSGFYFYFLLFFTVKIHLQRSQNPQLQHHRIIKQICASTGIGNGVWRPQSKDYSADGNATEGQWQLILLSNLVDMLKNPGVILPENDQRSTFNLASVLSRIHKWGTAQHLLSFFSFLSSCHAKGQDIFFFSSSLHLSHKHIFKTNAITHCPFLHCTVRYFCSPPQCPVAIHAGLTGWTTSAPHSTPAAPQFGPLTVWQLCSAKLTLSAV